MPTRSFPGRSAPSLEWERQLKSWAWRKRRKLHLAQSPACVLCEREGQVTVAKIVHHLRRIPGLPAHMYPSEALQSLCERHHNVLTRSGA